MINKSKGRTYADLIKQFGVDVASNIISSRLESNSGISLESKNFFVELDAMLDHTLATKSVTGYKGPEYWINSGSRFYLVDYKIDNCIIEYNGSFWHADERMFSENEWHSGSKKLVKDIWDYDAEKIDTLQRLGYNIMVIWSKDVTTNKIDVLTKCRDFINEYCNPCKTSN